MRRRIVSASEELETLKIKKLKILDKIKP